MMMVMVWSSWHDQTFFPLLDHNRDAQQSPNEFFPFPMTFSQQTTTERKDVVPPYYDVAVRDKSLSYTPYSVQVQMLPAAE
jgi:hypothetical protein